MAIINTTTETKPVTKSTVVWRATVEFMDDGTIERIDLHAKRVISDGDIVTERQLPSKVVIPDPLNTEQATRITRIDNSIEWLWKNTDYNAGGI